LVEETPCIDITRLRRSGVLNRPGERVPISWAFGGQMLAAGMAELKGGGADGARTGNSGFKC